MKRLMFFLMLLIGATGAECAQANPDSVFARLDTNIILIGQQTKLQLIYQGNGKKKVIFPAVADTFSMLEVVSRSGIDTVANSESGITLSQTLMITGFDSGYHVIVPFNFLMSGSEKDDTVRITTNPLLLQVQSIPVDTTQAIKDIKEIEQVPFSIFDHMGWILLAIGAVILFILWKKYSSRLTKPTKALPVAPPIPCHEKALQALLKLEQKKLWQQGLHKEYHTELTDILREFISERWNLGAMEMTTDEILALSFIPSDATDGIGYVLRMADMVKFAKGTPIGDENTRSLDVVRKFVLENKMQTVIAESPKA